MKNKASLIPVVLIALVGIVFASGIYFPDNNPSLPRLPTGPGTIGGVLSNLFTPDGTATNAEKLGDVTATGYLHNNNCTDPINNKWVGVDANGQGICGTSASLLAAIGKFSAVSPGVQVMKNGSSTWTPANTTDDLYPGDTISTGGGTATIDFALDDSLLRLDTGTTVALRLGNLDGNSVAEAILSDGRLWGRVITPTGINLGGGGIVAGVRGTSVNIEKNGSVYTMTIIDSQHPANAASAAPVHTSVGDKTLGTRIDTNTATPLSTLSQVTSYENTGTPSSYIYPTTINKEDLINASSWVRDNTKLDIDYLYANSGATLVRSEYDATFPPAISNEVLTALCSTDIGSNGSTYMYWKSLIGTTYDKCQSSSLVAFSDYSKGGLPLYFSGGVITANEGSTNNISTTGQYLAYNGDLTIFNNKTLKIELQNPIDNTATGKYYIADFGTGSRYYVQINGICKAGDISGDYFCETTNGGGSLVTNKAGYYMSQQTIEYRIPSTISSTTPMIIGAAKSGINYLNQIKNTINKIEIY